ncbi:MAG TPA: 30S ribosomal protein S9, partial [Candidatus Saccharimonadales bacterium]|nr:30S ribosomal protein S9 [Candidatus Saccharimonadales bacterium]
LGRRKQAIVTARLYKGGGEIMVGDKTAEDYFNNEALTQLLAQPIILAGQDKKLRITLKASGGGKRGQADAARLAIARALKVMNEELHPTLKKAGYLTRDPREKERKKPGLKRARKAPQFSKR